MNLSRRDTFFLLPSLVAARGFADESTRLASAAYSFESLRARSSGGNTFRSVLQGLTHAGCPIELHETRLAPGGMPHPAHHHEHEEMFLIREGTIEVAISGKTTELGPGGVAFVASGDEHGIRNAGATDAQYFVLAIGRQA